VADETPVFLEARNLVKRFGRVTAVNSINFRVMQGEVLTLLGPSGCGKTTTLRMVAGFERPDGGDIDIRGRPVVSVSRRIHVPPEKRDLGMVFQSYAIWPHMTVFENVAYPLEVRGTKKSETKNQVMQTLEVVGLGGFADRPSMLLSGGQQQRVALARALVYSPSILLLDEPLSNLDAKLRGQMRIELKRLQERLKVTVLFVTHDQIEAMSLSSHLAVMNQGTIEQLGTPREVYEHPATPFVEDFLGRVLRFRGKVLDKGVHGLMVEVEGDGNRQLRVETMDDSVAVGDAVTAAIRPEDIRLQRPGTNPGGNVLQCTVEKAMFLGAEGELVLRFGEQQYTLGVQRNVLPDLDRPGEAVELELPADQLRVWSERTTTSAPSH
jgi:ABC-type Fe3+/spermidine/putrescine transport system ATPase subunit